MSDTKSGTDNNPVYSYRAAEELDNDSWGTLVKATPVGSTWDSIKPTFDRWEKEYKDNTALPLPNAWRSAKSTVKSAISSGIPLVDSAGKPLGKTAVENAVKGKKGDEGKDPVEVLKGLIKTSYQYAVKHGLTDLFHELDPVAMLEGTPDERS